MNWCGRRIWLVWTGTSESIIVTGGHGGIGKEKVRVSLRSVLSVAVPLRIEGLYRCCSRRVSKCKSRRAQRKSHERRLKTSSRTPERTPSFSIRSLIARKPRLPVLPESLPLTPCGGVYAVFDKVTTQGHDMQFGVNVLGTEHVRLCRPTLTGGRPLLLYHIAPPSSHGDGKETSVTFDTFFPLGRISYGLPSHPAMTVSLWGRKSAHRDYAARES